MAVINDAYYTQLENSVRNCDVAQFSGIIQQHKANMFATKFREPSEKVFAENLEWLARKVILQQNGRNFKEPADITDADLQKLEILRAEHGFDYMKDLRIGFTATVRDKRLEYNEPFLVYLASGKSDLTDYGARLIEELVERLGAASQPWSLGISYSTRSGQGSSHNRDKNLFHVLVEGELTPNKRKIADLVALELAGKIYHAYAHTESWEGSRGQRIYQPWDTYRGALHSAVASGRIENVEYALSKGAKQSTLYNSYGSTAFADAAARVHEPAYRAIALRLFEDALTLEKGAEILRQASRYKDSSRPIEDIARLGDLPFTVAMAQANAGVPELAATAFTHTSDVTLGGYHSVAGGEVITHAPVHTTRTKTEWQISETGKMENPFPFIHQAVFNLDPETGTYSAYQDIFGKAIKYLLDNGALEKSDIPEDSLTDPRSLCFIFSLRAAAEIEKSRDPSFLAKTAVFTEGFADEVKAAKAATNNFQSVYSPKGIKATDDLSDAFSLQAKPTEQPIAVKGPLQLNRQSSSAAPFKLKVKTGGG